ncbi:type II toxin-antitoxin system RelE/ParE family toxin (plasmid) [Tistrella mobilis]|uniref:type II toxin-antitoxin system RelE/ParE family toxin n=1 Tax=Tistrella mobilis TaxID=171437 RepID=UPI0035576A0C
MPRLIWTPDALADVDRLRRFLASKSPTAAVRAVQAIRTGAKILAHHPRLGRVVDPENSAFREWRIDFGSGGYVVLYRVEMEQVIILAIRHNKEAGYS